MLCGCSSNKAAKNTGGSKDDTASVCYYKDDSGVFTGTEDSADLIKKTPSPSQRKIASKRAAAQLKSDQAYPGCFARSKDDLDIYGSPHSISSSDKASLYRLKKSPSIPILEMHEPTCSLYSQDNLFGSARTYQPYKGQLNLAVYINCGLLTVHVKESRQLSNTYGSDCNSYVKLALTPDETKRTKCKTSIVRNLNSPAFEEKFSFELLEGDMKKRLQISMWHKENNHSPSELLGCMSFGIKHIVQKKTVVDGWYFLLSDAIGRRKHLQVGQHHQKLNNSNTHTSEEDSTDKSINKTITPDSPHPEHMNSISTVIVYRSITGFGFQVTGERPAHILKIQEGSPSELSGLKQGDNILKVNDNDVSNLSSDTVARVLRQCPDEVRITYQRHQRKPPDILQGIQSPASKSQDFLPNNSDYQVMKPGSPLKERKGIMKTPGSPSKDRRLMKTVGSPSAYRREVHAHFSPSLGRKDYVEMTAPLADGRDFVQHDSSTVPVHHNPANVGSPVSNRRKPGSPITDRRTPRPHSSPSTSRKYTTETNDKTAYVNVGYGYNNQSNTYVSMQQHQPNGYVPNNSHQNGTIYSNHHQNEQYSSQHHQPVLNGRVGGYSNKAQSSNNTHYETNNPTYQNHNPSHHQNHPMQDNELYAQPRNLGHNANKAFNSFTPNMILPNKTSPVYQSLPTKQTYGNIPNKETHHLPANQNHQNMSNGESHHIRQPMKNNYTGQGGHIPFQPVRNEPVKYKTSAGDSDISSSEDGVHDYYIDAQVIRNAQQLQYNTHENGHVNGGYSGNQPNRPVTSF